MCETNNKHVCLHKIWTEIFFFLNLLVELQKAEQLQKRGAAPKGKNKHGNSCRSSSQLW